MLWSRALCLLSIGAADARRAVAVFVLGGGARRAEALRSLVIGCPSLCLSRKYSFSLLVFFESAIW